MYAVYNANIPLGLLGISWGESWAVAVWAMLVVVLIVVCVRDVRRGCAAVKHDFQCKHVKVEVSLEGATRVVQARCRYASLGVASLYVISTWCNGR